MLAVQRHQRILHLAEREGCVRVADLAEELTVTEETIRRDLKKLDEQGKLVRIHGGAVLVSNRLRDLPVDTTPSPRNSEERAIAQKAAKLIQDGDVVALDSSSLCQELARNLPDLELTVVTNSLAIAWSLVDSPRYRLISTGGVLDRPSLSYVGTVAEQSLERYNITVAFFSAQGIDLERGLTVANEREARLKETVVRLAERAILLADHTKFGVRGVEFFSSLHQLSSVVTDDGIDPKHVETLQRSGVPVEIAR